MATTMKVPTEFSAVDKFTSVVAKMTAGVSNFTKSTGAAVQRVNTKINNVWSSLDGMSQAALGVGFIGLFVAAGSAVMDYETALASLEAVTGVTADKFKSQIESIAKSSNKSAIDVAKSFEIVGSAMSQYLSDPKALGQITDAGILLSKAAKMELEPALESLTSAMNQFNLGAEMASDTVNRLTAGEIVGSVSTAKATEQLSKFGAVASTVNVSLPESIALIQTLGKKFTGAMQSEIGTAARNMLLIMDSSSAASKEATKALRHNGVSVKVLTDKTLPLAARLKELSKIQNDGVAMTKIFGRENAAAGAVIFDQLKTYVDWEKQIRETNKAQQQADVNSRTFAKSVEAIKNAFINNIVSGDKLNGTMDMMKDAAGFVAKNMGTILKIVLGLVTAFIALKAIIIANTVITTAYNIALGISTALHGKSAFFVMGNTLAYKAYRATVVTVTAAQWLWNAAMTANPIGLIIVGIAALIALITVIIYKWNEWGAALSLFLGPLGFIISLVMSFRKHWDMVKESFASGGILGGLKAIGKVLIDAVLMPIQQLLELLAKIPGMGGLAGAGAEKIASVRNNLGLVDAPETKNAQITRENRVSGGVDINVRDKGGNVESATPFSNGLIPVKLSSTQGAF